jgi:hypothetical protein
MGGARHFQTLACGENSLSIAKSGELASLSLHNFFGIRVQLNLFPIFATQVLRAVRGLAGHNRARATANRRIARRASSQIGKALEINANT